MNVKKIKQEQVVFLRNQDIFTTSQRGVTTANATGTLSGTKVITISTAAIKNIRSITVAAVTKNLGTDYTVVYGNTSTVITFGSNQTGDYIVSHDYGTDKIFPDMPRDDLDIDSYPRISVDILSAPGDAFGIGGDSFISDVAFSVIVYDDDSDDIDEYVDAIKDVYITNAKNFFYLPFIKRILIGPTIDSPDKKNEIMQKNIDYVAQFNVETN